MLRKIIIWGGVMVLVLMIASIISMLREDKQSVSPVDQYASLPDDPSIVLGEIPTSESLTVQLADGSSLSVTNFLNNPDTVVDTQNEGFFYLGEHYPLVGESPSAAPKFVVTYIRQSHYFNVTLSSAPISVSRASAELYLLRTLGITREQACSLNYTVAVPNYVDSRYSGNDLRFSFCPGNTSL